MECLNCNSDIAWHSLSAYWIDDNGDKYCHARSYGFLHNPNRPIQIGE